MSTLVLFDLDNTLIDRARFFREWATSFTASHDLDVDAVEWIVERDGDGVVAREELFAAVRTRFGITAPVDEMVQAYRDDLAGLIRPDVGVLAALDALRHAGCRIGVVTNGGPSQRTNMDRAGLTPAIDGCCVSQELGASKPSPRIFEEAARRCRSSLSGWMVGDSPLADIQGGQRLGLHTIWMSRGRRWLAREFRPDHVEGSVTSAVERILEAERLSTSRLPPG
jgi:FMN phosphatase YigB (HAD superfamily)